MKNTKYICFEGSEGTGKSTQIELVSKKLKDMGYSVLVTKEPGTHLIPLTQELRKFVLDDQYSPYMTDLAREYLMQAIRSIHLQKVIYPNIGVYDFIIQDRGQLSGIVYGITCGINEKTMNTLVETTLNHGKVGNLYDLVIFFNGDVRKGLERAKQAKREYESGDAMENKGNDFLLEVDKYFKKYLKNFKHDIFEVEDKSIEQSTKELIDIILNN